MYEIKKHKFKATVFALWEFAFKKILNMKQYDKLYMISYKQHYTVFFFIYPQNICYRYLLESSRQAGVPYVPWDSKGNIIKYFQRSFSPWAKV